MKSWRRDDVVHIGKERSGTYLKQNHINLYCWWYNFNLKLLTHFILCFPLSSVTTKKDSSELTFVSDVALCICHFITRGYNGGSNWNIRGSASPKILSNCGDTNVNLISSGDIVHQGKLHYLSFPLWWEYDTCGPEIYLMCCCSLRT